jgi:hypothetical protein
VVLTALQGKGLCGKEAYLLNDFLDTFVSRQKYLATRGQHSR